MGIISSINNYLDNNRAQRVRQISEGIAQTRERTRYLEAYRMLARLPRELQALEQLVRSDPLAASDVAAECENCGLFAPVYNTDEEAVLGEKLYRMGEAVDPDFRQDISASLYRMACNGRIGLLISAIREELDRFREVSRTWYP